MKLTFGSELEFADVKYGQPLPYECHWNRQDYSIVNSNGIANCPIGKYWPYGGEINTRPTDSTEEQVALFSEIINILEPAPVINYRCNLHIHVGIKGLKDDLVNLKILLSCIDIFQEDIFNFIEYVPKPTHGQYPIDEEFKGAMKRYRRRLQSHQSRLGEREVSKMLSAETPEEFYLGHFVTDKNGVPQKQLHQRCGINLRSLWENNETIEFRHFPGTINTEEFRNCVKWCEAFVTAALETHISPIELFEKFEGKKFPSFKLYKHNLELGYERTCHKVKPKEREENIQAIRLNGK